MVIWLSENFQRDIKSLSKQEQNAVFSVLLKLPNALKGLHMHGGVGIRKIHSSGIFEARVGLDLRVVFGFRENTLFCRRVGNHDEVQKFLKSL